LLVNLKYQRFLAGISLLAWLLIALSIVLIFFYAPREQTMGDVQKIFYFHVPSAWIAFASFFIVFLSSIMILRNKGRNWDILALSAAEIGFLFTTIVLITGPLWAKPVWFIWWTWDIRLTSTLILWLIYAGYFLLREFVPEQTTRERLAAVIGILAFVDIPIIYFSIRLWRTQHPSPVIAGGKGSGLDPDMRLVFFICLASFTLLMFVLLWFRYRAEWQFRELQRLRNQWLEKVN